MSNYWWDERLMAEQESRAPSILAIGDSWFWYPFYGGSLVNYLGDIVRPKGHFIFAVGMNGAEAFDYVDGKYADRVRRALKGWGNKLDAVFISGGGNDFAGFADLRPMLNDNCSAAGTAAECFRSVQLEAFFERIGHYYRRLVGLVHASTRPNCVVVMHTYAYAVPSGEGVAGSTWLKPALKDAKVPPHLQQACIKLLLDRFHGVLQSVCDSDPTHFKLVDSRNTLAPDEWANELHPTREGFSRIAHTDWKPELVRAGLA